MSLLKAAAVLALVASLAGCANLRTVLDTKVLNPFNDQQVSALGDTYGTAQAAVVAYAALPLCPAGTTLTAANWCHDKGLLKSLDADMHVAYSAYSQLVAFQQANPQGSTVVGGNFNALLSQAKGAIAALTSLEAAYKVGGAS